MLCVKKMIEKLKVKALPRAHVPENVPDFPSDPSISGAYC